MLLFRETGFPWQSLSSEQYGLEDRPDGSVFGLLVTKMPKQNVVQHLTISFTTEYGKIISCPITYDFSQCLLAGKK